MRPGRLPFSGIGRATAVALAASGLNSCGDVIDDLTSRLGGVEVFVNNAGEIAPPMTGQEDEDPHAKDATPGQPFTLALGFGAGATAAVGVARASASTPFVSRMDGYVICDGREWWCGCRTGGGGVGFYISN
ncbi:MAG TPA: hypothetical protein VFQ68_03380 [Streptosporangiaceae bacterium]|nr:hypothetical protein [Streptosporangiaceae bacterium]